MQTGLPWSSVEAEARQAYGRLIALLAGRSGDIAGAEDALGDALLAALERWPVDGTPANPQAWLLTVARRRGIDRTRQRNRADAAQAEIARLQDEAGEALNEEQPFPDARLGLLLACAHPAVDAVARTPLMLQAVLGFTAERMASAFLVSPSAMTKRLVRAKAKITAAGVPFCLPGPETLSARIEPLLDAIYAAFTLARDDCGVTELEGEAIWLGRLVAELAPGEPEAAGLLSLMLFVAARNPASRAGAFLPLSRQDPATWNAEQMVEAEERLRAAGQLGHPGRFQLEAAIQAVHADRRRSGRTDWAAILHLYDLLLSLAPTIGAQVAYAAALAQSGNAAAALASLDALEPDRVAEHQPYWATRAFALAASGNVAGAAGAYLRAAGLTERAAVRAWLLDQRTSLTN